MQSSTRTTPSGLWTVKDLADFLDKPTSWIYMNHKVMGIPTLKVGQALRFRPHEIEAWLDTQKLSA